MATRESPPPTKTNTKAPRYINEEKLRQLSDCESGTAARNVLEEALFQTTPESGTNPPSPLYGSVLITEGASDRPVSDIDLAIQTNIRNSKYSIMDLIDLNGDRDADRASLALLCLTVAGTLSSISASQNLPGPEILRFTVVWLLCFSPLVFLGYGFATPAKLQTLLVTIQRWVFPTYGKRMVQHEAGHFLIGHLLGLPVRGYSTNAVRNAVEFYPLSDKDVGRERAALLGFRPSNNNNNNQQQSQPQPPEPTEDKPFFSEEGSGGKTLQNSVFRDEKDYRSNPFLKLPPKDDPSTSWPYRGFDHPTLDRLASVSVAGVCAEILAYGTAEGGFADFAQLRELFQSAEPELGEGEMDNRVRYSLGFVMGQLRRHLGALDALVEVMERDGDVAECVLAIETCKNVSGASVVGDYEKMRRDSLQKDGVGIVERFVLGSDKSINGDDKMVKEGKGGGDRKQKFELTGDDPLYAALAATAAFVVWASAGGLSLH